MFCEIFGTHSNRIASTKKKGSGFLSLRDSGMCQHEKGNMHYIDLDI